VPHVFEYLAGPMIDKIFFGWIDADARSTAAREINSRLTARRLAAHRPKHSRHSAKFFNQWH